jgi:hypothetical protein
MGSFHACQNRLPDVVIPASVLPVHNAYDCYQSALQVYKTPIYLAPGTAVDFHLDNYKDQYGKPADFPGYEYNRRYPLSRKQIFLQKNAEAIRLVRQGLSLPYVHPSEQDLPKKISRGTYSDLARLLLVEAHAYAQAGNWDKSCDSLLDILRLGYQVPHGGALITALRGRTIRSLAIREFRWVLPRLSASRARHAIRQIEQWQKSQVTAEQTLKNEKREMQANILALLKTRDLRPLYVVYGCGPEPCDVPEEQYQNDLDRLPILLQMRLSWMNKKRIFDEYTRCMDYQIERMKQPYPLRSSAWPFPDSSDGAQNMMYPRFLNTPNELHLAEARENLLLAHLALLICKKENGSYPANLEALVPRYLSKVPFDPFSNKQTLRYRPEPRAYIVREQTELTEKYQSKEAPNEPPSASPAPLPASAFRTLKTWGKVPFTLYSIGPDARDNGGKPYQNPRNRESGLNGLDYESSLAEKCDIVSGINW